jgi:hypothetical protein
LTSKSRGIPVLPQRRKKSIRIRLAIDYFLRRYREDIIKRGGAERRVESQIAGYERELRLSMSMSGIANIREPKLELIQIAS